MTAPSLYRPAPRTPRVQTAGVQDAFCAHRPPPRILFRPSLARRDLASWCEEPHTRTGRSAPPCPACAKARTLYAEAVGGDWKAECSLYRLARRGAVRLCAERRRYAEEQSELRARLRAWRTPSPPPNWRMLRLLYDHRPRRGPPWHIQDRQQAEADLLRAHARYLRTLIQRRCVRLRDIDRAASARARATAPKRRAPDPGAANPDAAAPPAATAPARTRRRAGAVGAIRHRHVEPPRCAEPGANAVASLDADSPPRVPAPASPTCATGTARQDAATTGADRRETGHRETGLRETAPHAPANQAANLAAPQPHGHPAVVADETAASGAAHPPGEPPHPATPAAMTPHAAPDDPGAAQRHAIARRFTSHGAR